MKKYFTVTKKAFLAITMFRFNFVFTAIGNMLYITIIYFLWNSIYSSGARKLNGMDFNQVFVYLAVASTFFFLFATWVEWDMSEEVIEGSMVMNLVKPMDLQLFKLSASLGYVLINLLTVTIPTFLFILLVFRADIPVGLNTLFFIPSLILAYLIKFNIDFFVGLMCFYNESTWGMSSAKDSIIALLSGSVIPISFFPDALKTVVNLLPFQAIYNIPLSMLITGNSTVPSYIRSLTVQLLWVIVLFGINRLFYRKAIKVVTVNGG